MFQRQTRMERVDFYPLLRAIEPLIAKNEEMARRSSGSGISPEVTSTSFGTKSTWTTSGIIFTLFSLQFTGQ